VWKYQICHHESAVAVEGFDAASVDEQAQRLVMVG
jgi:hypothetical protein